ncbi:MAG: O-methyltransferase [Eubacterium sp.]|nr:O-methyltransferase [Eubacterium sp.]
MQDYDRIRSFIMSYGKEEQGKLSKLYRDAVSRAVPVIRPDTKELLRLLLLMNKPERILEIGTAVGYSALFMASCLPEVRITTLELDPERAREAEEHIREFGEEGRIEVLQGDAAELLRKEADRTAEEKAPGYDLVFIDAAKAQYGEYLTLVLPLVSEGAVIISDNVLQDGSILESHFLVEKRDRTIHDRMREYLKRLTDTEGLTTSILPVGDGVAVTLVEGKILSGTKE